MKGPGQRQCFVLIVILLWYGGQEMDGRVIGSGAKCLLYCSSEHGGLFVPGPRVDEAGRSSVVIDNVSVSDAGTYVCKADNSVGTIRALSFVRVRGRFG